MDIVSAPTVSSPFFFCRSATLLIYSSSIKCTINNQTASQPQAGSGSIHIEISLKLGINIKPQDKPDGTSNEAHASQDAGKGFEANFHHKLKCMALNINGIINI